MADIAGLSIAIFDQLLRLGERTAQLISDARSFNEVGKSTPQNVVDENNRTRQLRHILFEPSPIYGGLTLFENFDQDVQDQIKVFLGRLVHMLNEAINLLEDRYGVNANETPKSPAITTSFSQLSLTPSKSSNDARSPSPRSWKMFPKRSISLLKWSLQDKKRTGEVLSDFSDLNGRIHENIKLWCLASSIGLNMQHLNRLQNDESAKQLGFDIDATLQITATEASRNNFSYELGQSWLEPLRRASPVEERFALAFTDGKTFIMEHRRYDGQMDKSGDIDQRTKERINNLAGLLSQPKEKVFCIPRCVGWKSIPSRGSISFLFETPLGLQPEPSSLYRLLDMKGVKLTLGQRFRLALALAKCISQLQMVKWVHESFRSENILFFPQAYDETVELEKGVPQINYAEPCVLGFEFTRPELDFSSGFADQCVDRDIYRHPERQGRPGRMFSKIHDIYALGVVLLEIGLWQRAITLEKNQFKTAREPDVIQSQLLKQAQRRLGDKMGEKYQQVVVKCLTGEFGVTDDTREDLKLQQAFRTQVVDVLERIAGFI